MYINVKLFWKEWRDIIRPSRYNVLLRDIAVEKS